MKKLTVILLLFVSTNIIGQNNGSFVIGCDESFFVMYRDTIFSFPIPDRFYIAFEGGFDDTLEVYLNGVLISKEFYKTNPVLGTTGGKLFLKNKKNAISNILLIKNTSRNHCLEFSIDTRFRIIYIDFEEDKWGVFYSNKFTIYE